MSVTRKEAAKHLLKLMDTRESFRGFCATLYPQFKFAKFQEELIETLDKLERGDLGTTRLLITMPPRHGKSFFATVLFPVYYLACKPNRNVLSTSYNQDLAKTFGRQVRDHAREPLVLQSFDTFEMSDESRAVDDWRTTAHGSYYATGVGGSTTGRAATLLILDDPIKAREEAESATQRNKVWSYYVSALTTRKQPEPDGTAAIEIIILTRWHPDDVAGRIMETDDWKEGEWHHINFSAIQKMPTQIKMNVSMLPPDDPRYLPSEMLPKVAPSKRDVYKEEETALWPERFPLEELKKRERLDAREFASLYQQTPYVLGGNIIKSVWWKSYEKSEEQEYQFLIISADTAFKKTETADFSVLLVWGMTPTGDLHIIDCVRGKWDFPGLKRICISTNAQYRGKGLRGIYIEDKASGQSLLQELRTESGMSVIPYKVVNDKVARLNAVTPLIEGGRVFLPNKAGWLDDFFTEMQSFPSGKHDDIVDALSMGLDVLSRMGGQASDAISGTIDLSSSLYAQFSPIDPDAKQLGEWVDNVGREERKERYFVRWGE